MSRSRKIIRFTFWTNNLMYFFLALIYILTFAIKLQTSFMYLTLATVLGTGIVIYQIRYLRNNLGVKSLKEQYYFADDERERDISNRVTSELFKSMTYVLVGMVAITGVVANTYNLTTKQFGIVNVVMLVLALYFFNMRYYLLWDKYDIT